MNHLKLMLRIMIDRFIRKFFSFCLLLIPVLAFAQKDCGKGQTGLVPLTDLGSAYYRGYQGGLYANGSNAKPIQHENDLKAAASQLQTLDTAGNPDLSGKIVMIGVGASNPRTEFEEFMKLAAASSNVNPALAFANTCIGGQGVQKMNVITDNYWKQADHTLDSLGLRAAQVQIAWIETENTQTADTVFPRAPQTLVGDLNQLLQTMLIKFPNLRICYFSPRAFSGFASPTQSGVGKGLLFPRDYYNGWAGKWLIQNIIDRKPGYEFSGSGKVIPLCTFGSYHWSDGSKRRNDSFYLDCDTEVGPDGLHLTEAGEAKIAGQIFSFFSNDALARQWFLKNNSSAAKGLALQHGLRIYPNPLSGDVLHAQIEGMQNGRQLKVLITDISGRQISSNEFTCETSAIHIPLENLAIGIYYISVYADGVRIGGEKILKQ